jgi:hypothetical protein
MIDKKSKAEPEKKHDPPQEPKSEVKPDERPVVTIDEIKDALDALYTTPLIPDKEKLEMVQFFNSDVTDPQGFTKTFLAMLQDNVPEEKEDSIPDKVVEVFNKLSDFGYTVIRVPGQRVRREKGDREGKKKKERAPRAKTQTGDTFRSIIAKMLIDEKKKDAEIIAALITLRQSANPQEPKARSEKRSKAALRNYKRKIRNGD